MTVECEDISLYSRIEYLFEIGLLRWINLLLCITGLRVGPLIDIVFQFRDLALRLALTRSNQDEILLRVGAYSWIKNMVVRD